MNSRLPNLFILGAGRCGTTFLHEQLARHPEIYMSENKEPTFFCDFYGMNNPWEYLQQFAGSDRASVVGESSHAYLSCPTSAEMLNAYVPNAKFIVIFRNPVDRAYSLYAWMTAAGLEWHASFEAALEAEEGRVADAGFLEHNPQYFYNYLYYRSGLYGEQIRRYLSFFPVDRFLFLRFESLLEDSASTLRGIFRFLGVDPNCATHERAPVNQSRSVRSPRMQYLLSRMVRPTLARLRVPGSQKLVERLIAQNFLDTAPPPISSTTRFELASRYVEDLALLERSIDFDTSDWRRDAETHSG